MKKFRQGEKLDLKFMKAVKKPLPVQVVQINEPFEVEAIEGVMKGKSGDYLVIGVEGEMYVIDREIFSKTYNIVE